MIQRATIWMLAFGLTLGLSWAESDDVPTDHKLGVFFPLEKSGEHVVVGRDVLLSRNLIVKRGTIFRTVFPIPKPTDDDVTQQAKLDDRKKNLAMREDSRGKAQNLNAMQKVIKERAMKTVWTEDTPFRAMLNRYLIEEMFAVLVSDKGEPFITAISLPEGVLFADGANGPEVMWVSPEERGADAGFTRGQRVVSLNGESIGSLEQFQKVYLQLRSAEATPGGVVSIGVLAEGAEKPSYLTFKRPPSLSGSILDMP